MAWLLGGDLLGVNAAEYQQVVVLRQILQRWIAVLIPLYSSGNRKRRRERSRRHLVEHGETAPRGIVANGFDLRHRHVGKRMIEDAAQTVMKPDIARIPRLLDDCADLLARLQPGAADGRSRKTDDGHVGSRCSSEGRPRSETSPGTWAKSGQVERRGLGPRYEM